MPVIEGLFNGSNVVTKRSPLHVAALRSTECGACGLRSGCRTPVMRVHGEGKRGLLIVGGYPSSEDDSHGKPFAGAEGRALRDHLVRYGFVLDRDCWSMYALACHPAGSGATEKRVKYCRPQVLAAIHRLRPVGILLLGTVAHTSLLSWLYRDTGTSFSSTVWASWKIPCRTLNAWVCPTYSHSEAMRHRKKESEMTALDRIVSEDIEQCVVATKGGRPWDTPPKIDDYVRVIHDSDVAATEVCRMAKSGKLLSFDYETTTLKPDSSNARIICCAVSDGSRSVAFPWTPTTEAAVREMLAKDCPKTVHNLSFELGWSMRFGYEIRNLYIDTVLAAHAIDSRHGTKNLEFQGFVRLGYPAYSAHLDAYMSSADGGGNSPNKLTQVDRGALMRYCATDAQIGHELAQLYTSPWEK